MSTKIPRCHICSHIFALTALSLLSAQTAASLVITSNDSFISASASAGVWNNYNFEYVYDSDSASASQSFIGETANPGTFAGGIWNVEATAVDPDGGSSTWTADASLDAEISNPAAGQVNIGVGVWGEVAHPSWSAYEEGMGGASAISRLDLTFTIDTPYGFDLFVDHNGHGFTDANWSLTNVDTSTQIAGDYMSLNSYHSGNAELSPGNYRLFINFKSIGEYYDLSGSHYSSALTADFYAIPTPLPAAAWLFGSGLLGLIGISTRRKAA